MIGHGGRVKCGPLGLLREILPNRDGVADALKVEIAWLRGDEHIEDQGTIIYGVRDNGRRPEGPACPAGLLLAGIAIVRLIESLFGRSFDENHAGRAGRIEALLKGPTLTVSDLLALTEGGLLTIDCAVEEPLKLLVNGIDKFSGQIVSAGRKRAFQIEGISNASVQNQ